MHRSVSPALFLISSFLPVLMKLSPPWFRRTLVNLVPWKKMRRLRDAVDIMHNTAVEIFESKRRALQEGGEAMTRQNSRGKDIISILSMNHAASVHRFRILITAFSVTLVKANMEASDTDRLTEEEVVGQVMPSKIFLFHTFHAILLLPDRVRIHEAGSLYDCSIRPCFAGLSFLQQRILLHTHFHVYFNFWRRTRKFRTNFDRKSPRLLVTTEVGISHMMN